MSRRLDELDSVSLDLEQIWNATPAESPRDYVIYTGEAGAMGFNEAMQEEIRRDRERMIMNYELQEQRMMQVITTVNTTTSGYNIDWLESQRTSTTNYTTTGSTTFDKIEKSTEGYFPMIPTINLKENMEQTWLDSETPLAIPIKRIEEFFQVGDIVVPAEQGSWSSRYRGTVWTVAERDPNIKWQEGSDNLSDPILIPLTRAKEEGDTLHTKILCQVHRLRHQDPMIAKERSKNIMKENVAKALDDMFSE